MAVVQDIIESDLTDLYSWDKNTAANWLVSHVSDNVEKLPKVFTISSSKSTTFSRLSTR